MDHETSIKTLAAEKYLLGELSSPDRELFEQHFFECQECAEDVRVGFQFGENTKLVFSQDARPAPKLSWRSRLSDWLASIRPSILVPVGACLVVGAFSGYQNTVLIPALKAHVGELENPQVLSTALLAPSARSAVPSIVIPAGAPFVQLSLAIAAISPAERYQCELRAASGKLIKLLPISKLDPDTNLNLLIPASSLASGDYEAILSGVSGGTATQFDHYRFAAIRK